MQVLPAGGGAAAGKCNNLPSLLGSGDQDSGEVSVRSGQWSAVSPAGQSSFYRFVSESEHSHFSASSLELETMAFSWLKAPTSTFTFKTLHTMLNGRYHTEKLDVKLGCRCKLLRDCEIFVNLRKAIVSSSSLHTQLRSPRTRVCPSLMISQP